MGSNVTVLPFHKGRGPSCSRGFLQHDALLGFKTGHSQNQNRSLGDKTGQYPSMLDALEDYVKRQKKRLGIAPAKKEASN